MIEREEIDNITVLRLAHGKANVFTVDFLSALEDALSTAQSDGSGAIILTARGSIFSAGVDLMTLTAGGVEYIERFLPPLTAVFRKLVMCPVPVVAAVNGHAIAGGCILAQASDYRIMCGGRIGVSELLLGVAFPPLALEIMRYAVPPQHFQRLVLTGATVPADEAAALGLIDETVAPDMLMQRALVIARALAAIPGEAFRITKEQLRRETLERAEQYEASLGARIDAVWKNPETLQTIREYVEKTVGRKA